MKKIITTAILSFFLSPIANADDHIMRNDNPNGSLMAGKHMMNKNPSASVMEKTHMMNDNPFSSHSKKDDGGLATTNSQEKKGYSVIKYSK